MREVGTERSRSNRPRTSETPSDALLLEVKEVAVCGEALLFRYRISGLVEPSREVNQNATDSRNQLYVWVTFHASLRTLEKFFNDVCRCQTQTPLSLRIR